MIPSIKKYYLSIRGLNRNVKLYLVTIFLINIGFGVFQTEFNLYILSLGINPEFLGVILSLTPFAQALAAIPVGFLAEKIGNKRALILTNALIGFAYLLRVVSSNHILILVGAFLTGVMACGYFIIQVPFISHYVFEEKNKAFTFASIVFYSGISIGTLIGGFLPKLIGSFLIDETLAYRLILVLFSLLIITATYPLFLLEKDKPHDTHKISLSPYLNNIDTNTVRFAVIEFFIGLGWMFITLFINIIFVRYYQSNLEFFGTSASLLIVPTILLLFIGPALAKKISTLQVIMVSRLLSALFAFLTVLTINPWLGASAYLLFRSSLILAQSLGVAFAVSIATRRSRVATSAWLEATFDIGSGLAALLGGILIAANSFFMLGLISAVTLGISFYLTWFFFGRNNKEQMLKVEISE